MISAANLAADVFSGVVLLLSLSGILSSGFKGV